MKTILLGALMAIWFWGLVACGQAVSPPAPPTENSPATPSTPGEVVPPPASHAISQKQRVSSPGVAAPDLSALVRGNSAFAFDLYQDLLKQRGNLFYSPYSISLALAMTYAGGRGETEQQMAKTLHFTLPQDRLHPTFNALDLELATRGQGAGGKDGKGFRLNIVNALWGQQGYPFLSPFLDLLAKNYGDGLRLLDFIKAAEDSRITINRWVSDQTEDRIKDLLPPGVIDPLTRLVLTNAIYFNAAWLSPFRKEGTQNGPFHLLNGTEVPVPMMRQTESFGYAEGEGYQTVELLYDGRQLSMVILLPQTGQFVAFQTSLSAERVDNILKDLAYRQVALTMPKFEFKSDFTLKEALSALGMPLAFSPGQADFSDMTGRRDLFISAVVHQAFVAVDEAGTEAAAATGVAMATSVPPKPVEVTVDRPFIFLIRDIPTGALLFVGQVVDPRP